MYDVIIIGAGPAGLSAALTLKSKKPYAKILIIEKQSRCGRKLSASGNGKCNVTNEEINEFCYHSSDIDFIKNFLKYCSNNMVIDFFDKCGIPLYRDGNYYYPLSNQAKQVTSRFLDLCALSGVEIITDKKVIDILPADNSKDKTASYFVKTDNSSYSGKNVIIAAGSNASEKLGGSNAGYELSHKIGLSCTSLYPGLTPVYINDMYLSIAKGVRLNGTVTIHIDDFVKKESGQIQINEDNLSGIAIMNLSCYLPLFDQALCQNALWVDTLPSFTWDTLKEYIKLQCIMHGSETVRMMLEGFFPLAFVRYLLRRISLDEDLTIDKLTDKQLNRLTSNIKKLTFTPILKDDYSKAQVTLGGVSTSEVNPKTFECNRFPGLYVIGELLDMTGKCGGYNISFAVLSGISAADNIVKYIN